MPLMQLPTRIPPDSVSVARHVELFFCAYVNREEKRFGISGVLRETINKSSPFYILE